MIKCKDKYLGKGLKLSVCLKLLNFSNKLFDFQHGHCLLATSHLPSNLTQYFFTQQPVTYWIFLPDFLLPVNYFVRFFSRWTVQRSDRQKTQTRDIFKCKPRIAQISSPPPSQGVWRHVYVPLTANNFNLYVSSSVKMTTKWRFKNRIQLKDFYSSFTFLSSLFTFFVSQQKTSTIIQFIILFGRGYFYPCD